MLKPESELIFSYTSLQAEGFFRHQSGWMFPAGAKLSLDDACLYFLLLEINIFVSWSMGTVEQKRFMTFMSRLRCAQHRNPSFPLCNIQCLSLSIDHVLMMWASYDSILFSCPVFPAIEYSKVHIKHNSFDKRGHRFDRYNCRPGWRSTVPQHPFLGAIIQDTARVVDHDDSRNVAVWIGNDFHSFLHHVKS